MRQRQYLLFENVLVLGQLFCSQRNVLIFIVEQLFYSVVIYSFVGSNVLVCVLVVCCCYVMTTVCLEYELSVCFGLCCVALCCVLLFIFPGVVLCCAWLLLVLWCWLCLVGVCINFGFLCCLTTRNNDWLCGLRKIILRAIEQNDIAKREQHLGFQRGPRCKPSEAPQVKHSWITIGLVL